MLRLWPGKCLTQVVVQSGRRFPGEVELEWVAVGAVFGGGDGQEGVGSDR